MVASTSRSLAHNSIEHTAGATPGDLPAIAQILTSLEITWAPFGAQGAEYERQCEKLGRSDSANFPSGRSKAAQHARNVQAMAETLWDEDVAMIDFSKTNKKRKLLAAGWAEAWKVESMINWC
jgi:hypothetical protein